MIDFSRWWEYDKKEIMSYVYWLKDQLPPLDPEKYENNWNLVKNNLTEQYGGEK